MRVAGIVAGGLIGFVFGYFVGAYAGCWLYPTSNLCGIYGVFLTGPLGLVCGALGVWTAGRPKDREVCLRKRRLDDV